MLAGGLIGTGGGAAAGAELLAGGQMALAIAAVHTNMGVNIAVNGAATLMGNVGEDFHTGEFIVNSGGGAVNGLVTSAIPGGDVGASDV